MVKYRRTCTAQNQMKNQRKMIFAKVEEKTNVCFIKARYLPLYPSKSSGHTFFCNQEERQPLFLPSHRLKWIFLSVPHYYLIEQ